MFERLAGRGWLSFLVSSLCATGLIGELAFSDEKVPISRDEIVRRIKQREDDVKSATIEWTQDRFVAAGAIPILQGADVNPKAKRLPVNDETYESKHRFSFDGPRIRHWSSEHSRGSKGESTISESLIAFDGEQTRRLLSPLSSRDFFRGQIDSKEDVYRALSELELEPLLQCYRLFNSSWKSPVRDSLKFDSADPKIDGVTYLVASMWIGPDTHRFWLDPNRNCLVVRAQVQDATLNRRQTDFSYRQDADQGWMLSGWTMSLFDAQKKLNQLYTAKVLKKSNLNPQFKQSNFTIEFPVGTDVSDRRDGTRYILMANNRKRMVLAHERNATYQQLLNTESGNAKPRLQRPNED